MKRLFESSRLSILASTISLLALALIALQLVTSEQGFTLMGLATTMLVVDGARNWLGRTRARRHEIPVRTREER